MDPDALKSISEVIARFGVGGGMVFGLALILHKGIIRLGREVKAETEASFYKAQVAELQIRLDRTEKELTEFKAIAMKSIQVTHNLSMSAGVGGAEKGVSQ